MTKEIFLSELENELQGIEKKEREKYISYYDEMIEDYKEDGSNEEEVISKIGNPTKIAKEILSEQDTITVQIPVTKSHMLNKILLVIGFPLWGSILLSAFLLVFSVYIIIWCLPVITGSLCFSTACVGLVGLIGSIFIMTESVGIAMIQLGLAIATIGVSILSGMATVWFSKKVIKVSQYFSVKVISFFRKKVFKYGN